MFDQDIANKVGFAVRWNEPVTWPALGAKQCSMTPGHCRQAQFNVVISEHNGDKNAAGEQPA